MQVLHCNTSLSEETPCHYHYVQSVYTVYCISSLCRGDAHIKGGCGEKLATVALNRSAGNGLWKAVIVAGLMLRVWPPFKAWHGPDRLPSGGYGATWQTPCSL